jgi:glycosyltransferase involved in cell wall biosynthesis
MIKSMPLNKKSLVIVCAQFYPTNHIAAHRINSLVKYWDKEKYLITVYAHGDEKKEFELEGVKVFVLPGNYFLGLKQQKPGISKWKHNLISLNNVLMRKFSNQDYFGWTKRVTNLVIQNHDSITVLFTTFSPVDAHLVGFNLKKKFPNAYWIADMRDEMSANQMLKKSIQQYYASVEQKIISKVDLITAISSPILYGFKGAKDYLEVRNGFDHSFEPTKERNNFFTFIYAGTFYGKRKPDIFLGVLLKLHRENLLPTDWKLKFLGTHRNFNIPETLLPFIEFYPSRTNEEVIQDLLMSDCLLLIHPPSNAKGIFTGKVFDYLSVQRPILAMVDIQDVAAELIHECNAGFSIDFYDEIGIKDGILKCIDIWKGNRDFLCNQEKIHSLHRRFQVEKLVTFVEEKLNNGENATI